jgi:hypothetical protein
MRPRLALPLLLAILLGACSPAPTDPVGVQATQTPKPTATSLPTEQPAEPDGSLTRLDEQGAISVRVTPLNLDVSAGQLEFEVLLNTHSVDLGMDLAALASLSTDTGLTIPASLWDAPRGGHHVSGILIFPAAADGSSILQGARTLTLTIADLDAVARTFEWRLD